MKAPKKTSVALPKIRILEKVTKKNKKIPKKSKLNKTDDESNLNIHKIQVVPWTTTAEWDKACDLFSNDDYNGLMQRLLVWQARVPTLPVGVEGTLFIIQALLFDSKCDPFNPEDNLKARTLFSLALIRYMNHMSHLATQAIGGIGLPMFELASHMSIPSWLVDIRHEATHGGNLPSLVPLQSAAAFIKNWLQENYWIPSGSNTKSQIELLSIPSSEKVSSPNSDTEYEDVEVTEANEEDEAQIFQTVSEVISAFVASRVYFLRQAVTISDSEVTKFWPENRRSITTKEALRGLKHSINLFLSKQPNITCTALAVELIPLPEFYREFASVFTMKPMTKLGVVWTPIMKMLHRKKHLIQLCAELAKIHTAENPTHNYENSKRFSAIWIKRILTMIEKDNMNDYTEQLLSTILPIVMKAPNSYSRIFLKRLMRLIKRRVRTTYVHKIKELGQIWMEPLTFDMERQEGPQTKRTKPLVTLEEIVGEERNKEIENPGILSSSIRILDERSSEFWKNIPLGHVFST